MIIILAFLCSLLSFGLIIKSIFILVVFLLIGTRKTESNVLHLFEDPEAVDNEIL